MTSGGTGNPRLSHSVAHAASSLAYRVTALRYSRISVVLVAVSGAIGFTGGGCMMDSGPSGLGACTGDAALAAADPCCSLAPTGRAPDLAHLDGRDGPLEDDAPPETGSRSWAAAAMNG